MKRADDILRLRAQEHEAWAEWRWQCQYQAMRATPDYAAVKRAHTRLRRLQVLLADAERRRAEA